MKKISSLFAAIVALSLATSCSGTFSKLCKRCTKKDETKTEAAQNPKTETKTKKHKKSKKAAVEQVPAVSE